MGVTFIHTDFPEPEPISLETGILENYHEQTFYYARIRTCRDKEIDEWCGKNFGHGQFFSIEDNWFSFGGAWYFTKKEWLTAFILRWA